MKIKYAIGLKDVTALPVLVLEDHSGMDCMDVCRKISNFVYSHKHHVLRKYYNECKKAVMLPHTEYDDTLDGKPIPLYIFCSPHEDHRPYIDIMMRELNIVIEDLPASN